MAARKQVTLDAASSADGGFDSDSELKGQSSTRKARGKVTGKAKKKAKSRAKGKGKGKGKGGQKGKGKRPAEKPVSLSDETKSEPGDDSDDAIVKSSTTSRPHVVRKQAFEIPGLDVTEISAEQDVTIPNAPAADAGEIDKNIYAVQDPTIYPPRVVADYAPMFKFVNVTFQHALTRFAR